MKKSIFSCLLVCSSLVLAACQHQTSSETANSLIPEGSRIQNIRTGAALTPQQLLKVLSDAPMVIVGEEHTNIAHHEIELWLLQNLQQKRPQGSVLLEMITQDQQPVIDEARQSLATGKSLSESQIQETIRWNKGWPWPMYGKLVTEGLKGPAPLLSANISRARITEIYQDSTFPAGEHSSQKAVRDKISDTITVMHGGNIEAKQLTAMLAIQQHRDRFMAGQLLNAPQPALLFVGGYHAAKDVGVPLHIQDLNGKPAVVLILSTQGTTVSAAQADYVWYVPTIKK
ncbi:ChaN family lipoprotein [uncultured Cedecea sp.]|uniref:ChaN family lipoprotein n=1 Tax=uncultured Cedecea sp. TaxID=988762 RepID=UPI0026256CC5|nr:ChaN family lipoprotein [uncultured Cedecea sp.]